MVRNEAFADGPSVLPRSHPDREPIDELPEVQIQERTGSDAFLRIRRAF